MVSSLAFVATLVVAGQASHQFLIFITRHGVAGDNIIEEAHSLIAAQNRRHLVVMRNDNITVLAFGPGKACGR